MKKITFLFGDEEFEMLREYFNAQLNLFNKQIRTYKELFALDGEEDTVDGVSEYLKLIKERKLISSIVKQIEDTRDLYLAGESEELEEFTSDDTLDIFDEVEDDFEEDAEETIDDCDEYSKLSRRISLVYDKLMNSDNNFVGSFFDDYLEHLKKEESVNGLEVEFTFSVSVFGTYTLKRVVWKNHNIVSLISKSSNDIRDIYKLVDVVYLVKFCVENFDKYTKYFEENTEEVKEEGNNQDFDWLDWEDFWNNLGE